MKQLKGKKLKSFIAQHFNIYGDDIRKVTYIIYNKKIEYLINDHYLYVVSK